MSKNPKVYARASAFVSVHYAEKVNTFYQEIDAFITSIKPVKKEEEKVEINLDMVHKDEP